MRTRRRPTIFLASLATVALLAGCGGGDDDAAADDGIASLGTTAAQEESPTTTTPAADATSATDDSTADAADDTSPAASGPIDSAPSDSTGADDPPSTDPEQAMLDFAECMRDNGIDMPDPEFSGDGSGGGVMVASQEAGGDQPSQEEFEAAQEECQPLMDAAVSNIEIDPEQEAEMREEMLAYAACMRENGIDMPDPEFGENGQVTMSMGDPDSEAPAFDDEEFEAANEACGQEGNGIAIGAAPPAGDD